MWHSEVPPRGPNQATKFGSACHFFIMLHAVGLAGVALRAWFDWLADPDYMTQKEIFCGNDVAWTQKCGKLC
jgi:hypothetical protein